MPTTRKWRAASPSVAARRCRNGLIAPRLTELIRDVDPATSVMEFARQFDLTPDALATIKARAMRLTTRALLDDAERLDDIVWTILGGGREPRG